jgi:hypothetical protein
MFRIESNFEMMCLECVTEIVSRYCEIIIFGIPSNRLIKSM